MFVKLHIIIRPKKGFSVAECGLADGNYFWRISLSRNHIGGIEVQLHIFLTSALNGGEWLISRSLRFTSEKESQYITKLTVYTGCHRRNGPNFGRVFLMLNYTDITQNTYIQNWTVTEIMAREKCGHLAFPRNIRLQLCSALTVRLWRHKLRPTW